MNILHIEIPDGLLAIFAMAIDAEALKARISQITSICSGLQAKAEAEGRDMNADEAAEFNRLFDEYNMLETKLGRTSLGRQTDPQVPSSRARNSGGGGGAGRIVRPGENGGTGGFETLGELAMAVKNACSRGGSVDPRLIMDAPTTISTEGTGGDGGFAVPPDFRKEIWQKVAGERSILSMTDGYSTPSNNIEVPSDTAPPWDTSSGVQCYWEGEASQLTESKIALKSRSIRLHKITALVPVTEEMLEDAPSLDGYLRRKVGAVIDFKLNLGFIQGSGAGQPLGALNSPSLLSVAKETGQDADSLVAENIINMWSVLNAACADNAVWCAHPTILPKLLTMTLSTGLGGVPVYMPANTLSNQPYQALMGRPILFTQACNALGDKGDLIVADWGQYWTAMKTTGLKTDVSMHLWFDYGILAYRFILRITGMPWWAAPITGRDGTSQSSWCVTLDERA